MAIAIQEYLGFESHKADWSNLSSLRNTNESLAIENPMCGDSIMVDIEGIHVGPTRNYTWYTEEALRDSVPSWTRPYLRPVIMHHNESDGKIIGRIRHVEYNDVNTKSGTGALIYTANIPDAEGKEQVKDGRLKTVSIGVIVHEATCSICGHNIAKDGECEHDRGSTYGENICYWMIHKMEAKELSYVIVPSDIYAQNVRIYDSKVSNLTESKSEPNKEGVLNLSENKKDLENKESNIIDETVKGTQVADVEDTKIKDENKELKKEVEDLKVKLKGFEDSDSSTIEGIGKVQNELEEVKAELDKIKDELIVSKSNTIKEKQLRESAEEEILGHQKSIKENLVKEVMFLREGLGKESKAEDFGNRNIDSLKDSIKDLREETGFSTTKITIPENPGLSIEENTDKNVDKDKTNSNISLAEGLEDIFSGLVSSHTK